MLGVCRFLLLLGLMSTAGHAADVRERTRLARPPGTAVTPMQADDLTLTLSAAQVRAIQSWVRTAGVIDRSGKVLTVDIYPPDAGTVAVGQRARVFSPESKSSMYQARITRVRPQADRSVVEATLASVAPAESASYVVEIVVDRGTFLSVPNEALINEGDRQIVYVQQHPGHYEPQEVHTGLQGELYTQVLRGLEEGDEVVTLGSFFIDAEYKLKRSQDAPGSAPNEHHHH